MGYKIVEVENAWKIKLFLGNMQVFKGDDKIIIPINDIDVLIVTNPQLLISQNLIVELSVNNKLIIMCDTKRLPRCNIIPISGNYNSLKIIEQQMHWDKDFKYRNWTDIVHMKISSQSLLLKYFNLNNKKVDQYISEIDINDETNREAASAKSYFENMFGKRFDRRDEKQQYNITINSLLNYGYIVFTSLVARSIAKNGLDNRIGLFHKSFNNHFALACDLVEPFRVIVDCFTYKTVLLLKNKKNILDTEVKHKIIELIQRDIKIGGEKMSISLAVDKFVQSIINDKLITNIEYCFDEY